GRPPMSLREELRGMQVLSALHTAADLGFPDPAGQFQVHHDLAEHYKNRHFLDLGLEHWSIAEQAAELIPLPPDPKRQDEVRKQKKQMEEIRKNWQAEVDQRTRDFKLKTMGAKPLVKLREAVGPYRTFDKNNRQIVDP